MNTTVLPPLTVAEVAKRILASRKITRADQKLLMTLTFVNEEDQLLLDWVYKGLHRGTIRVSD